MKCSHCACQSILGSEVCAFANHMPEFLWPQRLFWVRRNLEFRFWRILVFFVDPNWGIRRKEECTNVPGKYAVGLFPPPEGRGKKGILHRVAHSPAIRVFVRPATESLEWHSRRPRSPSLLLPRPLVCRVGGIAKKNILLWLCCKENSHCSFSKYDECVCDFFFERQNTTHFRSPILQLESHKKMREK